MASRRERRAAEKAEQLPLRERLASHERPGAVLKGPPIAVKCPCGQRRDLAYGEVWECTCGRRWNTAQIPAQEYERLHRLQLRFRILPVCLGIGVSLLALFFILTHNTFSLFVLLPLALIFWSVMLRPRHRRRYAEAMGELPRWNLRPE